MVSGPRTAADLVAAGDAALARADWNEARASFEAALAQEDLAAAWEGLSWATWWLDDAEGMFAARERAFRAYRSAGDPQGAVRMAVWLAGDSLDFRGDDAVAAGWLERARRLLDGDARWPEHGWLALFEGQYALHVEGDMHKAAQRARGAAQIGSSFGVADLEAVGLALEGEALVLSGRADEGMRRLDEAAAIVSGEDFELAISPAWAQCILISSCEYVGDLGRVTQWCAAMQSLGERLNGRHVIGVCRSAYGHVLAARGDWAGAEVELVAAVDDLEGTRPGLAPGGVARLAELRVRQGRVEEGRALFERALPHPRALTGLGTLALDAGDARAAADAAERTLRRIGTQRRLDRIPALELLARARAQLGELEAAQVALDELEHAVSELGTPYLGGRLWLAAGELALACGEHDRARRCLEDAVDLLTGCPAPYEAALARVALARALEQLGRSHEADAEAAAASDVFAQLGAARDADRVRRLHEPALDELTARECEVLRLVATGLSDGEIARQLVVSPHTVHRHVANIRTKLRLPSRAAAVAYAARAGLLSAWPIPAIF
jgi:ATP/maltotriose-dependent transcriptional regulator MalT